MDSGIIISLINIISSVFVGFIPTIRREKVSKLKNIKKRLFLDIKQLHEIEEELLNKLQDYGHNKESLKREVRRIVREKNNDRPLSDFSKPSEYNKHINIDICKTKLL